MMIFYFKSIALAVLSIICVVITHVAWGQTNVVGAGLYEGSGPETRPNLVWSFNAGSPLVGTPQVYDGRVYISSFEGDIYALDDSTGEVIWEKSFDGQPSFQFSMNDEYIVTKMNSNDPSEPGYLIVLDRETGVESWREKYQSNIGIRSPLVYEDQVYFASLSGYLISLNFSSGEERWRLNTQGEGQPLIFDNILYLQDDSQIIYAVDMSNGEVIWSESSQEVDFSPVGIPVIGQCCLYSMIESSKGDWFILTVNRNTGHVENKFLVDHYSSSSMVLIDDVVFFGDGDGYMNAVNMKTNREIWRYKTDGDVTSAASVADNTVFFGSHDHFLYAVDLETGALKWRYETSAAIAASPAIVNGRIYVGNNDGYLYVLE